MEERIASIFGDANEQVQQACDIIAADPNLANGYHAIGFSQVFHCEVGWCILIKHFAPSKPRFKFLHLQGSQFMRAVAQRCPNPPIKNLISMAGQHQVGKKLLKIGYFISFCLPKKISIGYSFKGIFGAPACPGEMFTLCEIMRRLLTLGAYTDPIQDILIQAQV